MQILFIIPLVLMSLVSSSSWGLDIDDLVIRAGIYYEKFTATPFSGEIDEGVYRGSVKNGREDGYWEHYYPNGQLMTKGNFKDGKSEGYWEHYWKNGQLNAKGEYKNDKREGYWEQYWKDGTILELPTGTYKNGRKVSD